LTTSEIVGQFLKAWRWLATNRPGEERILNIVFMGQGEPLHNLAIHLSRDKIKRSPHSPVS
jgi:adenine C2-methylase RlmN of 23S rRNA A2503 and tRNA A37